MKFFKQRLGQANNLLITANLTNVLYKDTYQNLITENLTKAHKITVLEKSIVNLAAQIPYNGSRNVDTNGIEKNARKPETLQSGSVFKIPRSKTTRSISVDRAVEVKTKKLRSHARKKGYPNSPLKELLRQ